MSDQVTNNDINNLEERLDKRFENIDKQFNDLTAIMSRFADDVQSKLTQHDEEFRKMNEKYDHLVSTIDGFIGRIDNYETELAARDHKIDRLERWIQEIAAKTEVKLT